MSKFFRAPRSGSLPNTPKSLKKDDLSFVQYPEDDSLSFVSMDSSHLSINSNISLSSPVDETSASQSGKQDEATIVENEELEMKNTNSLENVNTYVNVNPENSEINIGTIFDQTMILYTARLVSSRFLLAGDDHHLIPDSVVRVTIKSLSLSVIASCVLYSPELLLHKLTNDQPRPIEIKNPPNPSECVTVTSEETVVQKPFEPVKDDFETDGLLDIKDDHFGECPFNYKDFLSPLSKSADTFLLAQPKQQRSDTDQSANKKLNDDLTNYLSKSEIVEIKNFETNKSHLCKRKSEQLMEDIFLYYNCDDPIIRGIVQSIVGNAFQHISKNYRDFQEFQNKYTANGNNSCNWMQLNILLHILLKGLSDQTHTVVKQSLASIDGAFNFLLAQHSIPITITANSQSNEMEKPFIDYYGKNILLNSADNNLFNITIENIINELLHVYENKYWVVQCKYCDLISKINLEFIKWGFGYDRARSYEETFLKHIYCLIGNKDVRVRKSAAISLCQFIECRTNFKTSENIPISLIKEFINDRIFNRLPVPFCNVFKSTFYSLEFDATLGKILYSLSNMLLDNSDKNQQVGTINAIVELIQRFNPIHYHHIWNEFNLLEICFAYITKCYATGIDLACQTDLIDICTNLLAGKIYANLKYETLADDLLKHILKILNIYHHVFTNVKPVFFPRGQKNDIFIGSKEFQIYNHFGYFGNDYFYLKIYDVIKVSYNSYKISINNEAGSTIMALLKACLQSLAVILETKPSDDVSDSIKLIEEILIYLSTIINFIPKRCVICIKHLLKYMFMMNFMNRTKQYEYFTIIQHEQQHPFEINDACKVSEIFDAAKEFFIYKPLTISINDKSTNLSNYIKMFEPVVFQCLKLFTKSHSNVQTEILNMLCQTLEYKVNYCLLDSNNVFIDFVLKLLDLIESGTVRNSDVLVPNIIKFLFHLSKEKDMKLVTIPKIINITDTLLANSAIKKSATLALNEIAYEFFFQQEESVEDTALNIKEHNTQKEVAFSMLIKFLDDVQIQKMLCTILLSSNENSMENENELFSNLLHCLQEKRIIVNDMKGYYILNLLFKTMRRNIILETKNLDKIHGICFFDVCEETSTMNFHNLALSVIYLENVVAQIEEVCLLNHIKFHMQNKGSHQISDLSEPEFFAKSLALLIRKSAAKLRDDYPYSEMFKLMFTKFITSLTCLKKFGIVTGTFKREQLSSIILNEMFSLVCENFDVVLLFSKFLVNIECEKVIIFKQVVDICSNDDLLYRKLKFEVVKDVCEKHPNVVQWESAEINYAIDNFMQILLENASHILTDMAASEDYSIILLSKLEIFLQQSASEKMMNITLDIFENCHSVGLSMAIQIIFEKFLYESYHNEKNDHHSHFSHRTRISKRSAKILLKFIGLLNVNFGAEIHKILPESKYKLLVTKCEKLPSNKIFQEVKDAINGLWPFYGEKQIEDEKDKSSFVDIKKTIIDDCWFFEQAKIYVTTTSINQRKIGHILNEIKSESKLSELILSPHFDSKLLKYCISYSLSAMTNSFKTDCMQYKPHINYLKISPLLKISLIALQKAIADILLIVPSITVDNIDVNPFPINFFQYDFIKNIKNVMRAVITLLDGLAQLENICIMFIEAKSIEKCFKENLLKVENYELFIEFATLCSAFGKSLINNKKRNTCEFDIFVQCVNLILRQQFVWMELNDSKKYVKNIKLILNVVYSICNEIMEKSCLIDKIKNLDACTTFAESCKQAILTAKFVEIANDHETIRHISCTQQKEAIISLAVSILRTDLYYVYAITPYELLVNYNIDLVETKLNRLPSIPIEYLNDVEIVEKFVKRINSFGYSSRHQFEEFFMTMLLLVNKESNIEEMEAHEEHKIKSICLSGITELLISCKMHTWIGCRNSSRFSHFPRNARIKADTISMKKLHQVLLLLPTPNLFYQPNLERKLANKWHDDIIGSTKFQSNQMEMNCIWQIIEESSDIYDITLKNMYFYLDKMGIDLKSSVQLIFDVFSQLIERNYILILPHLVKICEIFENRDHFKWIKDICLKLHDTIQIENSICHQAIIYCLCKSYAILVPSLSDLTHLVTIIQTYLKSTHIFVRNATIRGLLCLLESFVKTNTTIGSLSEELSLIRNVAVNYVIKHGVVEESSIGFSDEHTKLVWTLNFYTIETTSKFVSDCNLLSNTIISANNILKRTINFDQYLCILHGLERLVATNVAIKMFREKIEKIALDLVKLENERFSIPALKLLITCMYTGSAEQLENTEHSNGIVQDEPEVMVQSTEKIDVLFQRIKSSTPHTATLFGDVLCQITRDLVPPNEILTKVIKELLTLSQPHCEIIAKIVFQVFRSAIDSSYLPLLQDWLICSLPNFLSFPANKAVWCLTVIFISSSINLHLIKIFPEILAKYDDNNAVGVGDRELYLLTLGSRDFYSGLTIEQKQKFKFVFNNCELDILRNVVRTL